MPGATETAAEAIQVAERALQEACPTGRAFGANADAMTRVGHPHEQIVAAAQQVGADLIDIGRHDGDSLLRAWLGGVAQKVIGLTDEPVLVTVTSLSLPGAPPA